MKKILPPQLLGICMILITITHFLIPIKQIIYFPYTLVGILFFIGGIVFSIKEKKRFLKLKTNVNTFKEPNILLTDGLFKYTRNPMYVGLVIVLLGIAILFGSVSPFIIVVLFIIMTDRVYIKIEEKILFDTFGETYLNYKKSTRRWI